MRTMHLIYEQVGCTVHVKKGRWKRKKKGPKLLRRCSLIILGLLDLSNSGCACSFFQGVQSKWRHWRSTSLKRHWFWIRFFKFISQKEVTFVTIKTKVKEREPLFCCWTCTILLLMVGKFEGETSTKLITLLILRLPAKIQKYQIGPAGPGVLG